MANLIAYTCRGIAAARRRRQLAAPKELKNNAADEKKLITPTPGHSHGNGSSIFGNFYGRIIVCNGGKDWYFSVIDSELADMANGRRGGSMKLRRAVSQDY